MISGLSKIIICLVALSCLLSPVKAFSEHALTALDEIRASMEKLGDKMPGLIKNAKPIHIRTLERIFELNTYSLTIVEAYFKMLKIAVFTSGPANKQTVRELNSWLSFIHKSCDADIDYLDEAYSDAKERYIRNVAKAEKRNIVSLKKIIAEIIEENNALLE